MNNQIDFSLVTEAMQLSADLLTRLINCNEDCSKLQRIWRKSEDRFSRRIKKAKGDTGKMKVKVQDKDSLVWQDLPGALSRIEIITDDFQRIQIVITPEGIEIDTYAKLLVTRPVSRNRVAITTTEI